MVTINSQSVGDIFRQVGQLSAKALSHVNQPTDKTQERVHFHSDIAGVKDKMDSFGQQETRTQESFLRFAGDLARLAQSYLAIPQDTARSGINGRDQTKVLSTWENLLGQRGLIPSTFKKLSTKMQTGHQALSQAFESIAKGFNTIGRELKGLEGTYQEPAAINAAA